MRDTQTAGLFQQSTDAVSAAPAEDATSKPKHSVVSDRRIMATPRRMDIAPAVGTSANAQFDFFKGLDLTTDEVEMSGNLGYMATTMIYAALPHKDPKSPAYERINDKLSLCITNAPSIGIPYGKYPRLILPFICTQAKRQNSRIIELGKNFSQFAHSLGLNTSGGLKGSGQGTRLREQATKLFTSTITITHRDENRIDWNKLSISDRGTIMFNPHKTAGQGNDSPTWSAHLQLSESFFDECINHACPIDMRVLHALESSLACDIYVWLTYRCNALKKPQYMSWKALKWQFGSEYADTEMGLRNFKSKFVKQMAQVLALYPAKVQLDRNSNCLIVHPFATHIAPKLKSNF